LKTENINFKQQGSIKTLSDVKIKLNSTVKDMKIRISKAWIALNKL